MVGFIEVIYGEVYREAQAYRTFQVHRRMLQAIRFPGTARLTVSIVRIEMKCPIATYDRTPNNYLRTNKPIKTERETRHSHPF